jgi:hypothetical protein
MTMKSNKALFVVIKASNNEMKRIAVCFVTLRKKEETTIKEELVR